MKILERLALILFSIIILVIAVTSCLVISNILELKTIFNFVEDLLENQTYSRILLGSCIIAIILAIKALFFPAKMKKRPELKTGVLLENQDGRLLISKDTLENLVNSVVKSFDEAVDVQTKVTLDSENNVTVFISLLVKEDSVIKELSANIQNSIKETIKRSTDLNVNQVNINVKDIEKNKTENNKKVESVKKTENNKSVETNKVEINK